MIGRRGGFFPAPSGPGDTLAVLLHAYQQTPASLNRVANAVRETYPRADILAPRLPACTFSIADPERIAGDLLKEIGAQVDRRRAAKGAPEKGYERIILVGHSAGAVLARKITALAHGAT